MTTVAIDVPAIYGGENHVFSSNQQDAVNRARRAVKDAQDGLRDAKNLLAKTHRTENYSATQAVRAWERQLSQAEAELSRANAELEAAKRR